MDGHHSSASQGARGRQDAADHRNSIVKRLHDDSKRKVESMVKERDAQKDILMGKKEELMQVCEEYLAKGAALAKRASKWHAEERKLAIKTSADVDREVNTFQDMLGDLKSAGIVTDDESKTMTEDLAGILPNWLKANELSPTVSRRYQEVDQAMMTFSRKRPANDEPEDDVLAPFPRRSAPGYDHHSLDSGKSLKSKHKQQEGHGPSWTAGNRSREKKQASGASRDDDDLPDEEVNPADLAPGDLSGLFPAQSAISDEPGNTSKRTVDMADLGAEFVVKSDDGRYYVMRCGKCDGDSGRGRNGPLFASDPFFKNAFLAHIYNSKKHQGKNGQEPKQRLSRAQAIRKYAVYVNGATDEWMHKHNATLQGYQAKPKTQLLAVGPITPAAAATLESSSPNKPATSIQATPITTTSATPAAATPAAVLPAAPITKIRVRTLLNPPEDAPVNATTTVATSVVDKAVTGTSSSTKAAKPVTIVLKPSTAVAKPAPTTDHAASTIEKFQVPGGKEAVPGAIPGVEDFARKAVEEFEKLMETREDRH